MMSEWREIKTAAKIGMRVLLLVSVAGLVWALQTDHLLLNSLAILLFGVLLIFAFAGTAIVAMTLRNVIGRQLNIKGKATVLVLGWVILAVLLMGAGAVLRFLAVLPVQSVWP